MHSIFMIWPSCVMSFLPNFIVKAVPVSRGGYVDLTTPLVECQYPIEIRGAVFVASARDILVASARGRRKLLPTFLFSFWAMSSWDLATFLKTDKQIIKHKNK